MLLLHPSGCFRNDHISVAAGVGGVHYLSVFTDSKPGIGGFGILGSVYGSNSVGVYVLLLWSWRRGTGILFNSVRSNSGYSADNLPVVSLELQLPAGRAVPDRVQDGLRNYNHLDCDTGREYDLHHDFQVYLGNQDPRRKRVELEECPGGENQQPGKCRGDQLGLGFGFERELPEARQ